MIDFHSHVLPGIDDGSKSVEMSLAMLQRQQEQGVDAVIATPHFYALRDDPECFLQRRRAAFDSLGQTPLPVICGAEVAYFDGISRCEEISRLRIGETALLLLEMPFGSWSSRVVDEVITLMATTGLIPVLAHVDRYRSQLRKYGDSLLSQGVLFQCNAGAFLRFESRRWALKELAMDRIRFLGSDCHNLTGRAPNLQQAAEVIRKKLGDHPILTEQI